MLSSKGRQISFKPFACGEIDATPLGTYTTDWVVPTRSPHFRLFIIWETSFNIME